MMKQKQRFYLDCPYADKDECKELGAYWDMDKRKWFVPEGLDKDDFRKWWPGQNPEYLDATVAEAERFYLEGWYVHVEDKLMFKNWWPTLKEVAEEATPF